MKKIILLTSMVVFALSAFGQSQTITGQVTDQTDNSPLPGVSVLIKGTSVGTITDGNGGYSIEASPSDILSFSYIGFISEEIEVGNRSVINLEMIADVTKLEEIVVIGYGERLKKDVTSSISSINAKSIEQSAYLSPEMALQGQMAGVRVVNTSGNPNEAPQIFVRGIGTFAGSSQPLYVIDGQVINVYTPGNADITNTNTNFWNLIDANDIENISVLKDASAAAIYGSRGANGVILITTKKGKSGKPKVEFNARSGISNSPTYDLLNTAQFRQLYEEAWSNSANPAYTIEQLYGSNEADTRTRLQTYAPQFDPTSEFYIGSDATYDWQNEGLNKNARIEDYDVRISGGSDNFNYYLSGGYARQENLTKGGGVERYNLTANLNSDINKYLRAGVTLRVGYSETDILTPGNLDQLSDYSPWQPIYQKDIPFANSPYNKNPAAVANKPWAVPSLPFLPGEDPAVDPWTMAKLYGAETNDNNLALINYGRSWTPELRNMGQTYLEIEPIKNLKIRGGLSLDYIRADRKVFKDPNGSYFSWQAGDPKNYGFADGTSQGSLQNRASKRFNYQADLSINYGNSFGKHNFDITLVAQDTYWKTVVESFSSSQLTNGSPDEYEWDQNTESLSFVKRYAAYWFGYAGRLSYNYDSKYYLDVSVRRDATNGLPKKNRWGTFPSFTGAWRISDESFFKIPWVDNLKIRGGWGQAGNDENVVGKYAYLSTVTPMGTYGLGQGNGNPLGSYNLGILLSQFPNEELKWEVATTYYAGLDVLLFDNKLDASIEFYNRTTSGIQQQVTFPFTIGTLEPIINIGEVVNQGIDLNLNYNGSVGDFQYSVGGNISFLKNEVTKLFLNQPLDTDFGRVEVGRSIGHIWGYRKGGIFQTDDEVMEYFKGTGQLEDSNLDNDANGQPLFVRAGDMYFLNIGGAPTDEDLANNRYYSTIPDTLINSYDQTEIGQTIPGFTYGLNMSGKWKNFDFSLNWYGEGNVQGYNDLRAKYEQMDSYGVNQWTTTLDRWTQQNPSTEMPRAVAGNPWGRRRSDHFVESKAFFRLQNWQVGYSVPIDFLSKTNAIERLRIYVGGQNNLYFFKWTGIDPVAPRNPLPRSYWFGLNVTF